MLGFEPREVAQAHGIATARLKALLQEGWGDNYYSNKKNIF